MRGEGQNQLQIPAPLPLKDSFRIIPLSAQPISLDRPFIDILSYNHLRPQPYTLGYENKLRIEYYSSTLTVLLAKYIRTLRLADRIQGIFAIPLVCYPLQTAGADSYLCYNTDQWHFSQFALLLMT